MKQPKLHCWQRRPVYKVSCSAIIWRKVQKSWLTNWDRCLYFHLWLILPSFLLWCVCACMCMCTCDHEGQGDRYIPQRGCRGALSGIRCPSSLWGLRVWLGSLYLTAGAFIHWAILLAWVLFFYTFVFVPLHDESRPRLHVPAHVGSQRTLGTHQGKS